MENTHRFLAFDCGATSGRALLGTFSEGVFSMEEVCRFPNRPLKKDGKLFWDLDAIRNHFLECLKDLGTKGVRLDSIGIDTWGVDFGCIAPDGTLAGLPRAYRDPYTKGIPEEVFGIVPRRELYAATGIQIMDFNTVFQLYAQTRAGEPALRKAGSILFMPDLLAWTLTGRQVCEYTDASTSGMMDQKTRSFDKRLLERLGIRTDVLLPIVQPGTVIGPLKPEIAELTGLGPVPVVAVAGHDTASAVAAVPAADERFAYLSSGTWSLMGIEVPAPVIDERSEAANFTNEGGIEGTTRFLKNITGMWLLEQCREVWKAQGKDYSYPELVAMARREEDFPGRINPDDPRFAAPADMVEEILRSAQDDTLSDAQVVSCIFHSLAERYKEVLGILQGFAPFKIEKLHVIGGGSANDLLNQWTADAIGLPVVAGPVEATAIGNLLLQAKAAGLIADRWEMRRIISASFPVKEFKPAKH
ncbi:MAG: rhamnulokinase [Bacteroidales bacterium]|nr:rhamnulokinase [Bacteroidales bacterium]